MSEHLIHNPVIPGFYPDPSIVRVGEDFYLANSSFELCPGIPIFHSKDLAHWEQIGNALSKDNGFHVTANMGSGGIMAPTIRYHAGTFYIVCANFADRGNFFITAKDPAGPWSAPQWITDIPDIDCSLFFDRDGTSYLVSPGDDPAEDNHRAFFLTPFDLTHNRAAGERRKIWNSAMRHAWAPEAPHIYHIGDYYYLMIAEGGTEHFHSVMIARSRTVDGFYEGYPGNPVLTHRNLGWNYPIDNIGHADLVDTPQGNWYAVMLGSRIIEGQHKNLGRETYLCPVTWERGWPVFSPGSGKVEWEYPADPALPWTPYPAEPSRDDFDVTITDGDASKLGKYWTFWGTPYQNFWRMENSRLYLSCLRRPVAQKLTGFQVGVVDERRDNCVSMLCRRQRTIDFTVTLSMQFHAHQKEAAGLIIFQAANHQYRVEQCMEEGKQALRLVLLVTKQEGLAFMPGYKAQTTAQVLARQELPEQDGTPGSVVIRLVAKGQDYNFYYGSDEAHLLPLYLHADGKLINPEEVGGMVGTMLGMFATANGEESTNEAAFDYFSLTESSSEGEGGLL